MTTVVFTADTAYALPLAVAVRSVIDASAEGAKLDILILSYGLDTQVRSALLSSWVAHKPVSIRFVEIDRSSLSLLADLGPISVNVYTKLMVADYVDQACRRVIFLDADVIVLHDLQTLATTDLCSKAVGAVQDDDIPRVASPGGVKRWRELGLRGDEPFFNSGVLVIDLDAWVTRRVGQRAMAAVHRSLATGQLSDQQALNETLVDDWHQIDPSWNVTTMRSLQWQALGTDVDRSTCRIRHFTTPDKPWTPHGRFVPGGSLFEEYLGRTAWRTT